MFRNTMTIEICNLRMWRTNNWIKYDTPTTNAVLKLHYDQLLITARDKILESLNLAFKLKGICKDDSIILIINTFGKEVRKIKFQIKDNVELCIKELGSKFPVVPYNVLSSSLKTPIKFQSIDDHLKTLLEKRVNLEPLPPTPALDSFVKLCLLDPLFPQLVMQIEEVIAKDVSQKN